MSDSILFYNFHIESFWLAVQHRNVNITVPTLLPPLIYLRSNRRNIIPPQQTGPADRKIELHLSNHSTPGRHCRRGPWTLKNPSTRNAHFLLLVCPALLYAKFIKCIVLKWSFPGTCSQMANQTCWSIGLSARYNCSRLSVQLQSAPGLPLLVPFYLFKSPPVRSRERRTDFWKIHRRTEVQPLRSVIEDGPAVAVPAQEKDKKLNYLIFSFASRSQLQKSEPASGSGEEA